MIIIAQDVTDPHVAPFVTIKAFQTNPDGSTALLMPDGTFAYQEPMQYGVFNFTTNPIGPYQNAKVSGQLVSFWTRPQDPPYVYTWIELPN